MNKVLIFQSVGGMEKKNVCEEKWENEQSKWSICKLFDVVKLRCYFSETIQAVRLKGNKEEKCLQASGPLKMEKPLLPNVR